MSATATESQLGGAQLTTKIKAIRPRRRARTVELLLLILSWAVVAASLVLVQLGALGHTDMQLLIIMGPIAALTLGLHITVRYIAPNADPFILPIVTLLNGLGIMMIYRIDIANIVSETGSAEGITPAMTLDGDGVEQITWTALAIALAIATLMFLRNYRILQRYRFTAMLLAIVLLVLPFIPGLSVSGVNAQVWITVAGYSFQPGEVAKIALAVFFAGYLVTARDSLSISGKKFLGIRLPRMRDLGPLLVVWVAAILVLVVQRDLGTSLLYFGLFLVMLYVATGRGSWILIGLLLAGAAAVFVASRLSYVQGRVSTWLDPMNPENYEAIGGSFQLVQSMFGFAKGGLIGTGLGQGNPTVTPLASSDFIIGSLGEELGLVGLFAILGLYLLLVSRGFRIGYSSTDDFGKLLAIGLSFVIALQVFIVVGGVTRVIPLTGLTTPFLAAGGSSLVANWIIAAILLRLSDTVRTQRADAT